MTFEDLLTQHTDLPILTTDESFSTIEAQNMLLSTGQNTKSTKGKIDKISATVFLQEFLNSNHQKNGSI
jgi:RNase H-fold protein (predicted Holliday junction resolvase)